LSERSSPELFVDLCLVYRTQSLLGAVNDVSCSRVIDDQQECDKCK